MNPGNIQTDITANVVEDGDKVIYKNHRSQQFTDEDFVNVYNDTVQNLENTLNNIEKTEEKIQETLEEKNQAMNQIHTIVESEPQDGADLEADSVTVDDLNAFLQLQQFNQQKQQQQQQEQQLRSQLNQMRSAAERVAENPEEDLRDVPEIDGVKTGEKVES